MTDRSFHIVFAEAFHADAVERARGFAHVTLLDGCDEANLLDAVADCDALLVRSAARVTQDVLDRAKRLRVVGRGGAGLDNIDLDAARRRGITVVHTPEAATDAVADLTVGLLVGLLRKIAVGDAAVRCGRFLEVREQRPGAELGRMTLGLVGMGRIGRAVARRCHFGFGTTILYNDIVGVGSLPFDATPLSKQQLYRRADVVSLHVPLTDQTRGLIDATALSLFKTSAILINTSRGAVVDNVALAKALIQGSITGAALDVFDPEPLPDDHPLLTAPNTLFTPHLGARTHHALTRMNEVVDDVIRVLQGKPPRYPATSENATADGICH